MLQNLNFLIDALVKERMVDRRTVIQTLNEAMVRAAKRKYGEDAVIEAQYNEAGGDFELFLFKKVVEDVENPSTEITLNEARRQDPGAELGDELGVDLPVSEFGRIAAHAAKQVIIDKMRQAERDTIYEEFKNKKGELITGTVRRVERGDLVVEVGRTEGMLRAKDLSPRDMYHPRDRITCYVKDVSRLTKGPPIILSRTDSGLLIKLFQQEVPEIAEGIVVIVSAAREPGGRSKISVMSRDPDVDPVGACVGVKGTRVQAIIQELRGEKIDIVPWSPDPVRYVCAALAPASVSQVVIDEDERAMEVTVPDEQLSLAIGKKGQNVRLASLLTGWHIDIQSESKVERAAEEARDLFAQVEGVDGDLAVTLTRLGFVSLADLYKTDPLDLTKIPGVSEERARRIVAGADALHKRVEQDEERRKREVEAKKQRQRERQAAQPDEGEHELLRLRSMDPPILEILIKNGVNTVVSVARLPNVEALTAMGISKRKGGGILHSARQKLPKLHPELFTPEELAGIERGELTVEDVLKLPPLRKGKGEGEGDDGADGE